MQKLCLPLLVARSALLKFSPLALSIALLLLPAAGRAQTFSPTNTAQISIPDGSGSTTPTQYPTSGSCTNNAACIAVSGLTGSYTSMAVNLTFAPLNNNQTFSSPAWLLESPGGQYLDILSYGCADDTAQTTPISSITISLTDTASSLFPSNTINCNSLATGNYKPAHYAASAADIFPSPGPGGSGYNIAGDGTNTTGTATFASTFCTNASSCVSGLNGTWKLFAVDQGGLASPTQFKWTLTFSVTGSNAATTTSLSAGNPNPSFSSGAGSTVSLTATVQSNSSAVTSGTVTLFDNTTSTSYTPVALNGSGQATFNVSLSTQGTHQLYAVYNGATGFATSTSSFVNQTVVNHAVETVNGSVTTFCNSGPIALSSNAAGNPYPAMIVLGNSGITTEPTLTGTIQSVTVSLNGISLANGLDLDFIGVALQAPGSTTTKFSSNGNTLEFLSWAGNPYTTGSLTFSDSGSAQIPPFSAPSCSNNTCLPTDNWADVGSNNSDSFPSPAPSSVDKAAPTGSSTFLTDFGGSGVSGTWSLWVDNRLTTGGNPGSIGSWCLNFTTQTNAHPTTVTVGSSANPATFTPSNHTGTATVSFTATVNSDQTVNGGTVTFVDGTTSLGSATVVNGVATLSGVALSEGTHQIVASYGGTNTGTEFGISSAKYDERVNAVTANPTSASGSGPYSYCNTAAITAPGLTFDAGAAYPYPSNISVTKLPGTVKATTISLNGFNTKDQGDLMSLLVGPTTNSNAWNNNFDFFSLTGSNVSVPATSNLTFADGGANIGSTNLESSGTYAPESNNNLTFPQCPPNASDCGTENVGPPLGSSSNFTPTHKASPDGTSILGNASAAGVFGGTTASTYNGNGTWSLYLDDGGPLGGGEATNLTNGWCVNLTVNQPVAAPTAAHTGTGIGGDFVQGEQGAQVTVSIANDGPGSTGDPSGNSPMTVTDLLSSSFTYNSLVANGTDWTCSATGTPQTVTCHNDDAIAAGNSYPQLTIGVNVAGNAPASYSNSVNVSGAGVASTNSSGDTITIDPAPVLAVAVSHTGTFTQGFTAEWDVTVSNTAAGGRTNGTMTITDTLPTGYTLSGSSATGGTWGCGGVSNVVTCTSTSQINGGSNSKIALTVNVPANSAKNVSDSASVYGGGDLVHTAGSPATSNTDAVTVIQVPASISLTAGNNQSAKILTAFTTPLEVTVLDAGGVVINAQSVTFTTPATGATGFFSNSTTTITGNTNASGQISEVVTAGHKVGGYSVTVQAGTASNSFNLTNTVGPPFAMMVVSGNNQSTFDTAAFGSPLVVNVTDAGSNPVPNATITFTPPTSGASAAFAGGVNTATTDSTGTATSAALAANAQIGAYSVLATSGTGSTSFQLTNTLGPMAQLVVTGPGAAFIGIPTQFTVNAFDVGAHLVATVNDTLHFTSATDSAASLQADTALVNGTGTFTATLNTTGPQTITATDTANTIAGTSNTITVSAVPILVVNTAADDSGTASAANCSVQPTAGTTTNADTCSLRDALLKSASLGAASISFDSTVFTSATSITVASTLTIPAYTTITGPTSLVTVSGGNAVAVFTVNAGATTSLSNLIVANGTSSSGGSGLTNAGTTSIANCAFTGNHATGGGAAGAIENTGSLTITGCLLANNSAVGGGNGGAIHNTGTLKIIESTITGNSVDTGAGGGGIENSGAVTIVNSTVSGNTATGGSGGGIANSSTLNLANSIVAGNAAPGGANADILGTYADLGGNVAGNDSSATSVVNPMLALLGNYGGSTQTMLPLPGSPAICGGSYASLNLSGATTDQRGNLNTNSSYPGYGSPNIPCVDSGAVQTYYALGFSTQPSTSTTEATIAAATAITPAPAVAITENGLAGSGTVAMTAAAGTLSGTTSQTAAGGTATFTGLSIAQPETNDTLTATLPLNPALTTPLSLSTTSYAFNLENTYPTLTTPAPGTTLSCPDLSNCTVTFTWDPGLGSTQFQLTVGTTSHGSYNVYYGSPVPNTTTSVQVSNIPAYGQPLYVRLHYYENGVWSFIDYNYTEAGSPAPAALTTPSPGTKLTCTDLSNCTVNFAWDPQGSSLVRLTLGTTGHGSSNVYYGAAVPSTTTSAQVSNIPAYGQKLYARLYYYESGTWSLIDYTYTEAGSPTPPALNTPQPTTQLSCTDLSNCTVTFAWDPGHGSSLFRLTLGTTGHGSTNVYYGAAVPSTTTSVQVSNIPAYGATLYARLYYYASGTWSLIDYTYTEAGSPVKAVLTSPTPGSTLTGTSATFSWTAGEGVTIYRLRLGTTGPGSSDVYNASGSTTTALTTGVVSNIPTTGGTLYARLYSWINGAWQYNDYTYKEQ